MITVLLLNVYKITGDNIGDMRKKNPTDRFLQSLLPDYCLRDKDDKYPNKINYSDGYFQFVESGEQEYWMFNVVGADDILQEEISQTGIDILLEGYDLSKIFEKVRYNTYDDMGKSIPRTCHLFIELDYRSSYDYYNGGYECDMYTYIKGYLGENGKIVELPQEEIEMK
jgi:hypothetical protein